MNIKLKFLIGLEKSSVLVQSLFLVSGILPKLSFSWLFVCMCVFF